MLRVNANEVTPLVKEQSNGDVAINFINITYLPDDVFGKIASYLPYDPDLENLSLVSEAMHRKVFNTSGGMAKLLCGSDDIACASGGIFGGNGGAIAGVVGACTASEGYHCFSMFHKEQLQKRQIEIREQLNHPFQKTDISHKL